MAHLVEWTLSTDLIVSVSLIVNFCGSSCHNCIFVFVRELVWILVRPSWELVLWLNKWLSGRFVERLKASPAVFTFGLLLWLDVFKSFSARAFHKTSGRRLFGSGYLRQLHQGSWTDCNLELAQVLIWCCKAFVLTFIVPWFHLRRHKWGISFARLRVISHHPPCGVYWLFLFVFYGWLVSKTPNLLVDFLAIDITSRGCLIWLFLVGLRCQLRSCWGLLKSFVKLAEVHFSCMVLALSLFVPRWPCFLLWQHPLPLSFRPRTAQILIRFGHCTLHPVKPTNLRKTWTDPWGTLASCILRLIIMWFRCTCEDPTRMFADCPARMFASCSVDMIIRGVKQGVTPVTLLHSH